MEFTSLRKIINRAEAIVVNRQNTNDAIQTLNHSVHPSLNLCITNYLGTPPWRGIDTLPRKEALFRRVQVS